MTKFIPVCVIGAQHTPAMGHFACKMLISLVVWSMHFCRSPSVMLTAMIYWNAWMRKQGWWYTVQSCSLLPFSIQWWCGYQYCDCWLNEGIDSSTLSLVGESSSGWQESVQGCWHVGMNELRCQ
jgi:hypothetical protein